ncbi:YIP1 family protein [Acaryochloris sp. IP29b_bin.137]|uniref:YIP1 family protein n=1 Tax=Acaryochloris sp. IP29b_bin.137 TaxID=2969217 RepID=UPI00260EBC68|nr:YIP1 family protein [Acaryochloris sp. IP29b_bin.137]
MLDALFTTFFGPQPSRSHSSITVLIGFVLLSILALNAAGKTGAGIAGVIIFFLLFLVAGLLGWLWVSAALHFIAQLFGGQGSAQASLQAVMQGLWPLMISGPAIAASRWPSLLGQFLGLLLGFVVLIGTVITLTRALGQVHQLHWQKALLSVVLTLVSSLLAWLGLILWPLMVLFGL